MENNNKYLQNTMILMKTTYEDKDGNIKYNYLVPVRSWNGKKYVGELVMINSPYEHDVKDEITIKSNKSMSGEFYYTEVEELPFN